MSKRPDDNRNLLIAVALSMAVMLGWQFFYAGPQMKAQQEKAQREKAAEAAAQKAGEATTATPAQPGTAVPVGQPAERLSALPARSEEHTSELQSREKLV